MPTLSQLKEILVCPKCKGNFGESPQKEVLVCPVCHLAYPLRNGIPILLEDEALEIREGGQIVTKTAKAPAAYFRILSGSIAGEVVRLPLGSCKAIGRSIEDLNKTQVFNTETTVPLDDFTKKVVMNYLGKKMGKPVPASPGSAGLGSFKRLADLVLNDPAISRLHAMIFHDETGAGVLDLVSRNGTFVNGQEVESRTLKEGDLIEVGGTRLQFSYAAPQE